MQTSPEVSVPAIAYPQGGGAIKGVGETFQANPFFGTGTFSIPIFNTPARGLEPNLSLVYNSGSGNGIFGIGFGLGIPHISRRTEKKLPNYSDEDEFVLSNAEYLVPALVRENREWIPEELDDLDPDFLVKRFRTRTAGDFLRIERWTHAATGRIHWEVRTQENTRFIYGSPDTSYMDEDGNDTSVIANPAHASQIFTWLLTAIEDEKGNRIEYFYKADDQQNISHNRPRGAHSSSSNRYITRIKYGNYGESQWAFELRFDYGEFDWSDPSSPPLTPTLDWTGRQDAFSNYRAGFEIRTQRLCKSILLVHHFPTELGKNDVLIRATKFTYNSAGDAGIQQLASIEQIGYQLTAAGYASKAIPPINFVYSQADFHKDFDTGRQRIYQPLTTGKYTQLPGSFKDGSYQFIDLYGEGITGLLFQNQGITYYWQAEGEGDYLGSLVPEHFPIERNSAAPSSEFQPGTTTRVIVNEPGRFGYYKAHPDGKWTDFKAYEKTATDHFQDRKELVDVTGNGKADILIFEEERVKVYPFIRDNGYQSPITALRNSDIPFGENGSEEELIVFSDMTGDGLSDRVRVRNGSVMYWPNMGYGKFGSAVHMPGGPFSGETLDISRIRLADVDGSGTTDLIYFHSNKADIYLNKSGNEFSEPISIPLPNAFDQLDEINFADILGTGTSSLVITHGISETQHQYYDLTGGIKPYLLTEIDNQMGTITRFQYAPSTKFYLADKQAGTPWITQIPFPIQVIEKTEKIDLISHTRSITQYAYHHGAYDFKEREFAGFGMVEKWDTEGYEQFTSIPLNETASFELIDGSFYVPPIHTKTWYHTGLHQRDNSLSRQFANTYYQGDATSREMEDSQWESLPEDPDYSSLQEGYRALRGKVLREEIYADDGISGLLEHPFQVKENTFTLRMLQPRNDNRFSVYLSMNREQILYRYERDPNDPRIQHSFSLAYDEFGKNTQQVTVAYGRRNAANNPNEQTDNQATAKLATYLHEKGIEYRIGVLAERKEYEIGGISPDLGVYFSFGEIKNQVNQALGSAIQFDEIIQGRQARLIQWSQHFYTTAESGNPLAFGEFSSPVLLHHTESAHHSKAGMVSIFENEVSDSGTWVNENWITDKLTSLQGDGGAYVLREGYFWNQGNRSKYLNQDSFFLPSTITDAYDVETALTYDSYLLKIATQTDGLGNTLTYEWDYQTLKNHRITDINDNPTEFVYDPLGKVRAISIWEGGVTNPQGDKPIGTYVSTPVPNLDALLSDPHVFLQGATAFFHYDLFAWKDRQQPIYSAKIQREIHESDLDPGNKSPVQILLEYSDGQGRLVQQKKLTEAGNAWQFQTDGSLQEVAADPRWITSGRTIYNNKELPIKQYEPFYSDTPDFQSEEALTAHGVSPVMYYDPLGRLYQTDLPKGYFRKVIFTPWFIQEYDANDTLADSLYYSVHKDDADSDEKDALTKGIVHHNTPDEQVLDVWGRSFIQKKYLTAEDDALVTRLELDIQGNSLSIYNPRNEAEGTGPQISRVFDMVGNALTENDLDSGKTWKILNVDGSLIHDWDSREFHKSIFYDTLSRPQYKVVEGNGHSHRVEQIVYGESLDTDGSKNRRGQSAKILDQAGELIHEEYSFKGNLTKTSRRFRTDYKNTANWENNETLESETHTFDYQYDALDRLTQKSFPDGRISQPHYHPSGRLKDIILNRNGTDESIVSGIDYNARNQRVSIQYGNGILTTYNYDSQTFELKRIFSRDENQKVLQDQQYTYDAAGNITRMRDFAQNQVYNSNQLVEPLFDYTYDALYRLISASGREHTGLHGSESRNATPDYSQFLEVEATINNGNQLQNYARTYSYDANDNLIQMQHLSAQHGFTRTIETSTTTNRGTWQQSGLTQNVDAYFDASGNIKSLEHLASIAWNYQNQLSQATIIERENGIDEAEYYVYDFAGNRIRKVFERTDNGNLQIEEKIYFDEYEIKRIRTTSNLSMERRSVHLQDDQALVAIDQ